MPPREDDPQGVPRNGTGRVVNRLRRQAERDGVSAEDMARYGAPSMGRYLAGDDSAPDDSSEENDDAPAPAEIPADEDSDADGHVDNGHGSSRGGGSRRNGNGRDGNGKNVIPAGSGVDEKSGDGQSSGDGVVPPPASMGRTEQRYVLRFQNRDVAVGLHWELVHDLTRARETAVAEAKVTNTDLWCLKPEGDPQVGLGSTGSGHKRGMAALAAEIAAMTPDEWAGIFHIDDCYYVLSARNGTIVPESDIAFVDFETAKARFVDLCNRDVLKFYASPDLIERDLGMSNVEALDLETMSVGFKTRLETLSGRSEAAAIVMRVGFFVGAIVILAVLFPEQVSKIKQFLGLEQPPEVARVVIPPMPWAGQPEAGAMLDRCLEGFEVVPRDAGGWYGSSLTCDGRHLVLTVKRDGSVVDKAPPVTWLVSWVNDQSDLIGPRGTDFGRPILSDVVKGTTAQISWRVGTLPRWNDRDKPNVTLEDEQKKIWFEAEKRFLHTEFTAARAFKYWVVDKAAVVASLAQAHEFASVLTDRAVTLSEVQFDLSEGLVKINIRYHRALPFPVGKNIKIVRQPSPASVEGPRLPPPEK